MFNVSVSNKNMIRNMLKNMREQVMEEKEMFVKSFMMLLLLIKMVRSEMYSAVQRRGREDYTMNYES